MFNKDGMNTIHRLLKHITTCTSLEREFVNFLAYGIVRYMGKIDKSLPDILMMINDWCS
jgi:hypothetical protein